jgi:hypothetical protein
VLVVVIGTATLIYSLYSTEKQFYHFVQQWLNIRFTVELLLVTLVFFLGRRKKHA